MQYPPLYSSSSTQPTQLIGLLKTDFARHLVSVYPSLFGLCYQNNDLLTLTDRFMQLPLNERTDALATVTSMLNKQGIIKGWRNELLPISESFSSPPIVLLERASCAHFGVRAYGVHVNGFVREIGIGGVAGKISHLWVGTRSKVCKPQSHIDFTNFIFLTVQKL